MKCLTATKQPDGTFTTEAYINANGSITRIAYKTLQEIPIVADLLSKGSTDLQKDPDRVILFFDDSGNVISSQFFVFSTNKDDALKTSSVITDAAKAKAITLASDIILKESQEPTKDDTSTAVNPTP